MSSAKLPLDSRVSNKGKYVACISSARDCVPVIGSSQKFVREAWETFLAYFALWKSWAATLILQKYNRSAFWNIQAWPLGKPGSVIEMFDCVVKCFTELRSVWMCCEVFYLFGKCLTMLCNVLLSWELVYWVGKCLTELARGWLSWEVFDWIGKCFTMLATVWLNWEVFDYVGNCFTKLESVFNW